MQDDFRESRSAGSSNPKLTRHTRQAFGAPNVSHVNYNHNALYEADLLTQLTVKLKNVGLPLHLTGSKHEGLKSMTNQRESTRLSIK